ncbi:hypothetical protein BH18THE2_BH18THE2_36630 [soil metagenome]
MNKTEKTLVQDIKQKERKEDPLENFKHDKTTESSKSLKPFSSDE